jgi:hypothetical protein
MIYQLTLLCPKCGDRLSESCDTADETIEKVPRVMRPNFVAEEVRATALGLALVMDRHVASGCSDKTLVRRTLAD